jgi:hypothetical protein
MLSTPWKARLMTFVFSNGKEYDLRFHHRESTKRCQHTNATYITSAVVHQKVVLIAFQVQPADLVAGSEQQQGIAS